MFASIKRCFTNKKLYPLWEVISHLVFWSYIAYFFTRNSYLRPMAGFNKEILVLFFIIVICYANYFLIYPYLFKRIKWLYFLVSILSVLGATILEMQVVRPDLAHCYQSMAPTLRKAIIHDHWFLVFLRDTTFLAFFVILRLYVDANHSFHMEKENAALERAKQQAEINTLRYQIAPHFLFNNLTKLHSDIEPLSEPISEKVISLAQLLRYIIDNTLNPNTQLKGEIDFINDLLLLEKDQRYINLRVNFSYPKTGIDHIIVMPLLFETFISNAFKYVKRDDGYIDINLDVVETGTRKVLYFSCENDIESRKTYVSTKSGIENARKRLELLYPGEYELTVGKKDNIFRVELTLTNLHSES